MQMVSAPHIFICGKVNSSQV